MQDTTLTALENVFLGLSDKTRLKLLALMVDGEVSVGFLAESLGESQPKISRHLAYLRSVGLVNTRRDGKWVYYAIAGQPEPSAENVFRSTLNAITGKPAKPLTKAPPIRVESPAIDANIYEEPNIHDQPETSDWRPAEIDVFLL